MAKFLALKSSSQRNLLGVCVFVAVCLQLGYVIKIRFTVQKFGPPTIYIDENAVACTIQTKEEAYQGHRQNK